jgi:hypothetical protein
VRRGTLTTAALVILLSLSALAPTRPAVARAGQLQLSLDGRRWFSTIDRPLFDADRRWVPGDTETVRVWARNTSTDAADLTVRILSPTPGSELEDELRLSATANGQPLSRAAGYPVTPGDPVRVDLALTFPASAGNASQRRPIDVTLRLTLTQLLGTEPTKNQPGSPRGSEPGLPGTGLSLDSSLLLLAGPLLLTAGAAVLVAGRRSRPSRGER